MPKLKTNRSAAKRFKRTKNGKFKRSKANARHLMTGKSAKRRRRLRNGGMLSESDTGRVKGLLPYG